MSVSHENNLYVINFNNKNEAIELLGAHSSGKGFLARRLINGKTIRMLSKRRIVKYKPCGPKFNPR